MRINLRCCCTPMLVLGTVDVDPALVTDGRRIAFRLTDGREMELEVRLAATTFDITPEMEFHADPAYLAFLKSERRRELALYSNDTPIETARLIPSFVEVNKVIAIGLEPR